MLDLDWFTFVIQVANFVVLVLLLNRFLFQPLRRKLTERGQTLSETLQNARDQETEAAQLRREWEARLESAEQEAEETVHRAQLEAQGRTAEALEEARHRLDALTAEMRIDLERQRNEIVVGNYDEILDTIIMLSGNVVQSVTTRRSHDDLVTNFCASIYQMPQTDVEEYRRLMMGRVPTAFVTTPVTLSAEQAKTLADTLSSLIDRRVELQVSIDPELVAGIQVRLADKLIDNSVRQQLYRIRDRVRRDLIAHLGTDS